MTTAGSDQSVYWQRRRRVSAPPSAPAPTAVSGVVANKGAPGVEWVGARGAAKQPAVPGRPPRPQGSGRDTLCLLRLHVGFEAHPDRDWELAVNTTNRFQATWVEVVFCSKCLIEGIMIIGPRIPSEVKIKYRGDSP